MQPLARAGRTLLAALVLVGALAACGGDDKQDGASGSTHDAATSPANEGIDGVLKVRVTSANHTKGEVDYDRHPPAGGDHDPVPAPCGFYTQQVPDENAVHTMEHGGVWLAYATDLAPADLAVLQGITEANADVITSPYPGLDAGVAVVASAWERQLTLTSVDDPRLVQFVARYQNDPRLVEAAVPCQQL